MLLASIPLFLIMLYAANDRRESEINSARFDLTELSGDVKTQFAQTVQTSEHLFFATARHYARRHPGREQAL